MESVIGITPESVIGITGMRTMANHLRTELVLEALNMAIAQRRPEGVIHHSDSENVQAGSLRVI